MAPWDEIKYFQPIKETGFGGLANNGNAGTSVAAFNQLRTGILFSWYGAGQCLISTKSSVQLNQGMLLSGTSLTMMLLQKDVGPLTQSAFWATAQGGINAILTVIEILMVDWPTAQVDQGPVYQKALEILLRDQANADRQNQLRRQSAGSL